MGSGYRRSSAELCSMTRLRVPCTGSPMRWSIRNQILIPLIGIQAVAVTAATLTTATLAAGRSEREIIGRLNEVLDTLEHGSFPYTGSVLAKMRGLSGAHFIAWGEDGPGDGNQPAALEGLPPSLRDGAGGGPRRTRSRNRPSILVGGTRYFAVSVRSPSEAPAAARSWCFTPRRAGTRRGGKRRCQPLLLGTRLARSDGARDKLDRPPHQRADPPGASSKWPGSPPATSASSSRAARRDEVADLTVSINRMCSQLKGMRQTIQQSERARLLAQLAAGLAHQLRNSLTGARHERPVARQAASGPGRRRDARGRLAAARAHRGAGQGTALGRPRRARAARALRPAPAPGGCRAPGRSGVPARQGYASQPRRGRARAARCSWPTGRACARRS